MKHCIADAEKDVGMKKLKLRGGGMTTPEFTIREITREEHTASLRKELEKDGLYKAIEARCNEINDECRGMTYGAHRCVQEQLCEILELVQMR